MNWDQIYIWSSLALLGPLCLIAIWTDLRQMLIKNWLTASFASLACVIVLITLGWQALLWHVLFAVAIFFLCYIAFHFNQMGGGDLKLFVGVAIALGFWTFTKFLFILSAAAIVTLLLHRAVGLYVRPRDPDQKWGSFHRTNHFPYGVTIGLAYIITMGEKAITTV
ncbi:MAG: prepilin peptidase [Pseudomonadota bacterium]